MVSFVVATILTCLFVKTYSFPCPFAKQCNCTLDVAFLKGRCDDVHTIPIFTDSELPIALLTLSGNFTAVPSKAFNGLRNPVSNLVFERQKNTPIKVSLTFTSESFVTEPTAIISSIKFVGYNTDLFVNDLTLALANARDLTELSFDKCRLDTLRNDSFNGLKTLTKLDINNANLREVEDEAFNGTEMTLNQLSLAHNDLREVPRLEKLENLALVDLSDNRIEDMDVERGFPKKTIAIDLSDNYALGHIDDAAFLSVDGLKQLSMNRCNFTEIPTLLKLPNIYPFVEDVQMNGNKIHHIDDTFSSHQMFTNLTSMPGLNDNPVDSVESRAFNGLVKVERVYVTNYYDLPVLDIGDFSSRDTADMKSVRVENFRLLESVQMNPEDIGDGLNFVSITYCDRLNSLNDTFGIWLNKSSDNMLDISNNKNFGCDKDDHVRWIAKYAFCSFHPQVIMDNTFCADTRVPLEAHLRKFEYVCDE